ncbi:unnamed protein product [Oppiella nova]|uniref:acetylcholinesterase n=1 Tax=Oppiella nova TaxID=334625 RepID=A0A7R9QQ18_9ACAR|nr:unnamed protein product [Oppiella nova]CAG2171425.1 unnamed protein product [Oppiella nova]
MSNVPAYLPVLYNKYKILGNQMRFSNLTQIHIKPKLFTGFTKQVEGREVNIFLGIPYARPPIGDLRFRKPVPIVDYPNPVNATSWANPCQQSTALLQTVFKWGLNNANFNEDCLYLNIWAPGSGSTTGATNGGPNGGLKPVLVWIHGGDYYAGAANSQLINGEVLSAKMDVIVVTFNYRFGWFGFLYAGTDDAPGNVGLWDQALALKWVNENVYYFGGDPNRVTIAGDNSGSISVSLHLLSPITRNLYRNAIMISGGPLRDVYLHKDKARDMWSAVAVGQGCGDGFQANGSADCLRAIAAQNLIESTFDKRHKTDVNLMKPYVIYGDEFLPKSPVEMLKSGDFKKNVNLLVGTTVDEGSNVLTATVDSQKYSQHNPQNLSKSEARLELANIFRRFLPHLSVNAEDIYRLYVSHVPETDYPAIRRAIGRAIGDYLSTCPTLLFANGVSGQGDVNTTRVFQYVWSVKYDSQGWHGSDHGLDIGFIFGAPFRDTYVSNASDSQLLNERRVSLSAMETVANFARYGNPGKQEGIEWQPYYATKNKDIINPYFEFTRRYFSDSPFGVGFKYECNHFWHKYVLAN